MLSLWANLQGKDYQTHRLNHNIAENLAVDEAVNNTESQSADDSVIPHPTTQSSIVIRLGAKGTLQIGKLLAQS